MTIDRREIKELAKKQIKGNILTFFGLSVVMFLILGLVSFTYIGTLVLAGPIYLGFAMFVLEILRSGEGKFGTGFEGFRQFGSAFVATLLSGIFVLLWSILFIIPGIIAGYRYSMVYFILADNPSISGSEAIKKSKEMMAGHKWELFVLQLSFIGWFLLCCITFGIAAIWVYPYYLTTIAAFYDKVKSEAKTE